MRVFSHGRPWLVLVLAAVLVLVVLLAVVLSSGSGSDEDEVRVVRGTAEGNGFPLRGDRAGDDELIGAAIDAWRTRATRGGASWAGDRAGEVTVLWAGRTGPDHDTVVLAAGTDAAVLKRNRVADPGAWGVVPAVIDSAETPRVVASTAGVLVAANVRSEFRPSEAEAATGTAVRQTDGLWNREGVDVPAGAVVVPVGFSNAGSAGAIFTGGTPAVRKLSTDLLQRLTRGPASRPGPAAQRLVTAARAAGSLPDDARRRATGGAGGARTAVRLSLISERSVAPFGPLLVLGVSGESGLDRPYVVAAFGGSDAAGATDARGARLGGFDRDDGLRAVYSPVLGAAYVHAPGTDDDDAPYLLVAGDQEVDRIEVLAGDRRLAIDGSEGAVRATWADGSLGEPLRAKEDVAVLGREADGTVIVPSGPAGREQAIR